MKTLPAPIKTTARILALALATIALATSCAKKTPAPEPFTAQLEDIDGVMLLCSLQHPRLISQSLDKLIAEIPEASYGRILLENYGAQFGYPEFTEIATDASIGIVIPTLATEQLKQSNPTVMFIKLKENGKLWNALVDMAGMSVRKHGDWAMFARNDDALAAIPNPAAVIAKLNAPQAENLRVWTRANGDTAAEYKTLLADAISNTIDKSLFPNAERTALNACTRIILDEIFDSTHSGRATIHLSDTGLQITLGAQYKPDTPIGTFLRYRSAATPAVGQYIANDALLSAVIRVTPKATQDLANHLTNLILKVDYPPIAETLATFNRASDAYWSQTDGCGAMTTSIDMDLDNPRAPKSTTETFVAYSGNFDQKTMQYQIAIVDLTQKLLTRFTTILKQSGRENMPQLTIATGDAPVKINGYDFSTMTVNISGLPGGAADHTQTTYYGIAGKNLVTATSEAVLQNRLPALLAKKPLPDNVATANPLQPYDLATMTLNGGALVDMVCKIAKIDLADADRQAALVRIKDTYAQSAPPRFVLEARQAAIACKIDIPYKFVSISIKLGQFTSAAKRQNAKQK